MPPTFTTASTPAKLPKSSSWWLMLSTLASLLLAGNSLRPRALAIASAPVAGGIARRPAARVPRPPRPGSVAAFSQPTPAGQAHL